MGSNNKSKQNEWNKENIYAQAIKKKFQYKTRSLGVPLECLNMHGYRFYHDI